MIAPMTIPRSQLAPWTRNHDKPGVVPPQDSDVTVQFVYL
jgi:hypothetical protein